MHINSKRYRNTVKSIVKEFNNKKIYYAFARNYEQYPDFNHDIDFLSNEPIWKLKKILIKIAKKNNWDNLIYDNHFSGLISKIVSIETFRFYKYNSGKYEALHLDFFRSFIIWGLPLIKATKIQRQKSKKNGFFHLNLNIENMFRLLQINSLLSNKNKFQESNVKKKINFYQKKIINFAKKNKDFSTKAKNYGIFFAKDAIKFLIINKFKKFKFYIHISKLLFFIKFFFLNPISFFYHIFSRIIDYLNYYFLKKPGLIINFHTTNKNQKKNVYKSLNLLKDLNFINYWQVKKSKILLTFQERKILERMGIIIFFSSKLNHDSIIVKKKDNLDKISKLIINKLIKKNLIIYQSNSKKILASYEH